MSELTAGVTVSADPGAGFGLDGKIAIVTGAASGIGRATAELLAKSGCLVTAVDVNHKGLATLDLGDDGATDVADLSVPAACEQVVAGVLSHRKRLDILVNAAAILRRVPIAEADAALWEKMMDTNLLSQFFLCRAAGEAMKPRKWGRIVNCSSGAGLVGGFFGATAYAITKAGIMTMTRSFAKDLGPHGITVNTLSPGAIDTPMQRTGVPREALEANRARVPLGRMGLPAECARGAVFLASDLASYVNGHILAVDGGFLMR